MCAASFFNRLTNNHRLPKNPLAEYQNIKSTVRF